MSWEGDVEHIIKNRNNMSKIEGEQKYFTAQEAREVSMKIRDNRLNEELDEIYGLINDARFEGKTAITLSRFIDKLTQEFLEKKGFTIKMFSGTQWDPCNDTTISW